MLRAEHTLKYFIIYLIIALPTLSFAAWPLYLIPPGDPNADQSTVYSSNQSIRNYTKYFYDKNRNLLAEIEYDGSGKDGIWSTGDDIVDEFDVYRYDSNNNRIMKVEYDSAGPDGMPQTGDDIIARYLKYLYDTNGDMYRSIKYTSPGTDGKWFTNDDSVSSYDKIIYFYDLLIVRDIDYNGPGPDGEWFTSDDTIEEYDNNYFYSSFRRYNEKDYIGSGPDGLWFTPDDIQREEDDFTYDSKWNLTRWIETELNVDDTTFYYDGSNNCTRLVVKRDDVIRYYMDFIYDGNGRMIEAFQYTISGNDGIWFTPDDIWSRKIVNDFLPPPPTGTGRPWLFLLLFGE